MFDGHAKVGVALIVFYLPIIGITLFLTFRHGFSRGQGWFYLVLFSLIRFVSGIITIVAEQKPTNIGLQIANGILIGIALSPLLLATLGFLKTVASIGFEDKVILHQVLSRGQIVFYVAIALVTAGGVQANPENKPSTIKQGHDLQHAGIIILAVLFVLLVLLHAYLWTCRERLTTARLTLLKGISAAVPFLLVRVIYSVISVFSNSNLHSKWSPLYGSVGIFVGMALIMEYIVVCIYIGVGISIPYSRDENRHHNTGSNGGGVKGLLGGGLIGGLLSRRQRRRRGRRGNLRPQETGVGPKPDFQQDPEVEMGGYRG
jgi:hypothetical protein